nr:L,D-transpeptidase family protein [Sphingomonas sediminicola]
MRAPGSGPGRPDPRRQVRPSHVGLPPGQAGPRISRCDRARRPWPKQQQGDGRVPEGSYRIVGHNPNSAFHLSLRIGYPTPEQVSAAAKRGVNPGGDIMIHGLPNDRGWIGSRHTEFDWTDGCVAVTNREIEWLYKAVRDGTPVEIQA